MKLILLKNNFKDGLNSVGKTLGLNTNLPILSNVLIQAENNQVKFSTTNLEIAVTKIVSGKIIEEGSLTVPYPLLSSIVNNMNTERINLESKDNNLIIKTDNYEATLQGADRSEYPIIPTVENRDSSLEVKAGFLNDGLVKTVIAAEVSDLRPEISGVLFWIDKSGFKLVATDSFRLAEYSLSSSQYKNSFEEEKKITIPMRTAQEITRITSEEDIVKIYVDDTQILFVTESAEIISRTIEGDFPDYQAIIPKEHDTRVFVDREELINGVKLASSFSGRGSELTVKTKNQKVLEIHSSDSGLGGNKYLVPAKIEGPDTEILFNWQFLLDGLKSDSSKEVVLDLNGEEKPTIIKPPSGANNFYILMPIRP